MERAIDPLLTIDAKLWADEFMATKQRLGDAEFDHAMMLGWFANAIMQGYDEGQRRAKADAQATIAALQAQLNEQSEKLKYHDLFKKWQCWRDPDELVDEYEKWQAAIREHQSLKEQLTQRTAERDTARRRVDELEAREVDVVMLREDLEQRTAELEAAKGKLDIILRVSRGEPEDELAIDYGGLGWENDPAVLGVYNLIADLEHVKGERDSALELRDWWQAQLDKERAKLAALTATSQEGQG